LNRKRAVGSVAVSVIAVQLDRGVTLSADEKTRTGEPVKPWNPAKPARAPILPPQGLKLRNADIFIIEDRCKGCSFCIEFCPRKVLELSKKVNQIGVHPPRVKDSSLCVGCDVCEEICPDFAIFLVDKEETR
jgi:2-oxoglutarate ferredoxin oxidoreductase subunit delta